MKARRPLGVLLAALAVLAAPLAFAGLRSQPTERGTVALRASWDLGRFSRTVSFFKGSPWRLLWPFGQNSDQEVRRPQTSSVNSAAELTIVDWGEADGMPLAETWGQLDDVVMGGVSKSRLFGRGGGIVFEGATSRENNGGFCSFRSRLFSPPFDLRGYDGLRFKASCRDGLRYKLQLRDNRGWDSMGYSATFDVPKGEEVEVSVPFDSLVANFRSRSDPSAPPLRRESIYSIQFVLSAFEFDKEMNPRFKEGDFQLELGPIRAYRDS